MDWFFFLRTENWCAGLDGWDSRTVEWTAEIAEWQNTKRQATIANLISSRDNDNDEHKTWAENERARSLYELKNKAWFGLRLAHKSYIDKY
jgi:hypothetical protein